MSFWKKLRTVGSILILIVVALTACAALVLRQDDPPPASVRGGPVPHPGLDGLKGTTGL